MNKLILFSKLFKELKVGELITLAQDTGVDGFDLCVRPGYPINPDNAAVELVKAVRAFRQAGLDIPMVTGNFDLLFPEHPTAVPILSAMDKADVRLIKLGYYFFDPVKQDYWQEVERIRKGFERWAELAKQYNVRICYHTHALRCMGLNGGTLAHLLRGFDPRHIGAYLDTCHLSVEGEEFAYAAAIMKDYLSIIGLKDVLIIREETNGHGRKGTRMVPAGEGVVDFTTVFADLSRLNFQGPLSVHCEFEAKGEQLMPLVKREIGFFRTHLQEIQK